MTKKISWECYFFISGMLQEREEELENRGQEGTEEYARLERIQAEIDGAWGIE